MRRLWIAASLVVCAAAGLLPLPSLWGGSPERKADSPSWPRFHGPHGDNVSRETGLLRQWPEAGPRLLWTARGIGQGYSGVSLGEGLIYTSGNLKDRTVITALDLDGRVRWQVPGGEPWTGAYPGTRGTPTVDGARLYHESPLGEIVCLDARTSKELWALNILEEFDSRNVTWGLAESLVVDGDRLLCTPGGPYASIVALDKRTGKTVWTAPAAGGLAAYATPAVVEWQGMRIVLTMMQKALIGVNALSGELLFCHASETRFGANAQTPLFSGGRIFITSGYGCGAEMLRLQVDGGKASLERLWHSADLDNLHGGVVLLDGHVYGAAHESPCARHTPWVSLAGETGATKRTVCGLGMGSLTAADGMLYMLSEKGEVGLVEAAHGEMRLVSRFRLPDEDKDPTWAHPVVCGARLYIRHGDRLYAFDVHDKRGD